MKRMQSLLNCIDQAGLLLGRDGLILCANQPAENLFMNGDCSLVGERIEKFLPENLREAHKILFDYFVDGFLGPAESVELCFEHERVSRVLKLKASPVPIEGGSGLLEVYTDISSERNSGKELRNPGSSSDFSEEFDPADYFFIVAHDLKGPLIGTNRLLAQMQNGEFGKLDERVVSLLGGIIESNDELLLLLQNLVEFKKQQLKKYNLRLSQFNVSQLLSEQTARLAPGLRNRLQFCARSDLHIVADKESFARLYLNLIDNASKYAFESSTIEVVLDQKDSTFFLSVISYSEPISESEQEAIFELFCRGSASEKIAGSGLGLYICRKIAEAHKGEINCKSNGNRNCFELKLPLHIS